MPDATPPDDRPVWEKSYAKRQPTAGHCQELHWENGVEVRRMVKYEGTAPKLPPPTHVEYDGEPLPDYD